MIGENIKKIEELIVDEANEKLAQFRSRRSVGIDIADRSIEVVELEHLDRGFKVNSSRSELPAGLVKQGRILDAKKLAQIIKDTFAKAQPEPIKMDRVVFGMPESQVYSHVYSVPTDKENKELADLVKWEAETAIPVPFADQLYSYKVLESQASDQDKGRKNVLILAISKTVVLEWHEFFKQIGVEAVILDFEIIASYRVLLSEKSKDPVCIVDIGAEQTILSVLNSTDLFYSFSVNYAGEALTRKIITESASHGVAIEYEQAEDIKKSKGLAVDSQADMARILGKALEPIVKQVESALVIGEKRSGAKIKTLILVGGSASMPGLAGYLDRQLNGESSTMAAEKSVSIEVGIMNKLGRNKIDIKCSEAAGLALRVMERGLSDELDVNGLLDVPPINKVQDDGTQNMAHQPGFKQKTAQLFLLLVILFCSLLIWRAIR